MPKSSHWVAELSSALLNFNGMQGASLQLVKAMEKEQWQTAHELLKMIRPASKMDVVFQAMYDARAYADKCLTLYHRLQTKSTEFVMMRALSLQKVCN